MSKTKYRFKIDSFVLRNYFNSRTILLTLESDFVLKMDLRNDQI